MAIGDLNRGQFFLQVYRVYKGREHALAKVSLCGSQGHKVSNCAVILDGHT